jgi:hypothetical protein
MQTVSAYLRGLCTPSDRLFSLRIETGNALHAVGECFFRGLTEICSRAFCPVANEVTTQALGVSARS